MSYMRSYSFAPEHTCTPTLIRIAEDQAKLFRKNSLLGPNSGHSHPISLDIFSIDTPHPEPNTHRKQGLTGSSDAPTEPKIPVPHAK